MTEPKLPLPFYLKFSQVLTGIIALVVILYVGQGIILPLAFAVFIAIVLNPVVNRLQRLGINRILSIVITLVITLALITLLTWFISYQIAGFVETLPALKKNTTVLYDEFTEWMHKTFHLNRETVTRYLNQLRSQGIDSSSSYIGQTLVTITGAFGVLILMPVYVFLVLLYKPLILGFIAMLFKNSDRRIVTDVVGESRTLIQSYLYGLLVEMALVAVLNSGGLLLIGMKSAILLGVIAAILNVIPYLGGVIATALAMLVAVATKGPSEAWLVLFVFLTVQLIDNNFLVPKIVASQVRINALASIVVVLMGGVLWGVPGMFIAIPVTALCKVIFDHIEDLKPFGLLLGDTMPRFGTIAAFFNPTPKIKSKD
jgi:predicted PurR-regulated permease PerM